MSGLEHAIHGLQQALDSPRRQHMWRWLVRNRLSAVKEALHAEGSRGGDAWLAAREITLHRERNSLLRKVSALGPDVLDNDDLDRVSTELQQLVGALQRYRQRVNDLVYDSVSLELGGSE